MNPRSSPPSPKAAFPQGHRTAPGGAARLWRRKTFWLLLASVIGLLAIERTPFRLCLVKGDSMRPSLHSGDLLVVDRQAYHAAAPKRGDIVVADNGRELLVKRVVGLPGELVELRLGDVYVNRFPYPEPYLVERGTLSLGPGRLLDDRYALLGDNRNLSADASVHAVVAKHRIVGRVIHTFHLGLPSDDQNPNRDA